MLAIICLLSLVQYLSANMNNDGIPYMIGNPSLSGSYSTEFTDDYFDVYGQVQTRYSQVYWTRNDPVPLPQEIVERFKGKVMAITGYEADQVMKTSQGDVPFPIYKAYNHHYFAWLIGADADMVKLDQPKSPIDLTYWDVIDKPNSHGFPTNIVFKENPGGEYRKSYHGYPKGFAQLIHSPQFFVVEPMQIDTHNRAYNGPGYKPWFWPKSINGTIDPHSMLDPLIECPCSDRISKVVKRQASIITSGVCTKAETDSQNCFDFAKEIVTVSSTKTTSSQSMPYGCLLVPDGNGKTFSVIFNTETSSTQTCGNSEKTAVVLTGKTSSLVDLTLNIDTSVNLVTITMTGPNGVWYGVGFNAASMADEPYTIIVDGTGVVTERDIGNHNPGDEIPTTVKVVSNTVANGNRTVVLTRAIAGNNGSYYSFPVNPGTINFINAFGNTPDLEYHQARTPSQITLVPTQISSCLCAPTETTFLAYMNQSMVEFNYYCAPEPRGDMAEQKNPACKMETYHGGIQCCHHGWFLTDIEQESMIPPDVDTYYLKFRYYFQEYTPSNPPSHEHLHHWVFLIDAEVNDYEEIQCADGTMCEGSISAHLTARDMGLEDIPQNYSGIMPLVIAAHCHAPSCIREELYNADTGDLLCRVTAQYGTGSEPHNEAGYVALPPCLFGNQDGLRKPVVLTPDTNLMAIKVFNNTYRHLGQMAQWTGLMVYLDENGNIIS